MFRPGLVLRAVAAAALLAVPACATPEAPPAEAAPARPESVPRLEVEIVAVHPHDAGSFTQGLLWHDGWLYESAGGYGESRLSRVDLETGEADTVVRLPDDRFGEGLARVGSRLIQLTWTSEAAFVYDLNNLQRVAQYAYEGQGWGLCFDGDRLVMSNGSPRLAWRDAATFEVVGELEVRLGGAPLRGLNELECAEGWIYANVLPHDSIVRIDPASGEVVAVIDAPLLDRAGEPAADALNGIAYNPDAGTFYLTGKYWPSLFEVRFVKPVSPPAEPAPRP